MSDIDKHISVYHKVEEPMKFFGGLARDLGFDILHIEVKDLTYDFGTLENLKSNFGHMLVIYLL
jgi:hypothetical protein